MTRLSSVTTGLAIFAVLFAFFWVVPNGSDLGSNDLRCYEVFRYESGDPKDEAALWPPGGKCRLETETGVVERPRGTPVLEWTFSALLAVAVAATAAAVQTVRRRSRR